MRFSSLIPLKSAPAFRTGKLKLSHSSFLFCTFHYLLPLCETRNVMDGRVASYPHKFISTLWTDYLEKKLKNIYLEVLQNCFGHLRVEETKIHWLFWDMITKEHSIKLYSNKLRYVIKQHGIICSSVLINIKWYSLRKKHLINSSLLPDFELSECT